MILEKFSKTVNSLKSLFPCQKKQRLRKLDITGPVEGSFKHVQSNTPTKRFQVHEYNWTKNLIKFVNKLLNDDKVFNEKFPEGFEEVHTNMKYKFQIYSQLAKIRLSTRSCENKTISNFPGTCRTSGWKLSDIFDKGRYTKGNMLK